jgi:formate-dependent phosphoribosylglycinamide formyltransferase (GAR transformylase)
VFGVELFVKGDIVWFSEVSPRPNDIGTTTMASQVQSEFEPHAKRARHARQHGAARTGLLCRSSRAD